MDGTGESYTCACCGGEFVKGRGDEEAEAERFALLGPADPGDSVETVCDDCWLAMMGRIQIEAPELLQPGAAPVPGTCYRTGGGLAVHVRPACRCPGR
jgi:hypothetical protein